MNSSSVEPNIFDVGRLASLKRQVKGNDPQALKEAARQFEALFLQMVLKSMRDATPKEGMFDSEQTRMYESLLDQQLTQVMAGKGGTGLAAMIEKQLTRASGDPEAMEGGLPLTPELRPLSLEKPAPTLRIDPLGRSDGAVTPVTVAGGANQFVDKVWPHAQEAARSLGIPPHFLVAQAALETGWGKSEPRFPDGRPSYNLFGLKAGRSWTGPVVESATIEYVDGVPQRQVERFRAYASYGEAFADYAQLMASSPRYAAVRGSQEGTAFAHGLQRAGYATDPMYAVKLERIISGATLRQALIG
ncbi:flagellar assembly peptidoglycan hydrolase FlgJ [Denitratisoma oestradiolicum]|uniref:Peptidoglycan hydrolase FlgJ n=1 Tax=Denitratisoma oestradiolicum TaxID=311182 RepID=A0A6S6XX13_9PROT|nr:flagellar assembly peptidoglycan hydrolase FlgJ [Denitratisoma oestradiolicum]TWO81596.1 flagellar assembly peptidoglycan hydrolase FlgJ [Denitratisoma oestradiolicum]CAB1370534.1 muramidase [Denitratisoma oestradiolicum]